MMDELTLFVHDVFVTTSSTAGITCEECGTTYMEGQDIIFTHDKGKQIAQCCFNKVFAPRKRWVDAYADTLFYHLLRQFKQDPLNPKWAHSMLREAVEYWAKATKKAQLEAQKCMEVMPK